MKIIFMGRRPHACEALEWLVEQGHNVLTVVAPNGVGSETPYWTPILRETAIRLGVPVTDFQTFKKSCALGVEELGEVDLVVSFLFWKRITPVISNIGKYGCINFHPAPLPDYKGLGGYNFAILDRLEEWGTTAHYVDATFDTGPIVSVRRFPFDWRTATAFTLEEKTRGITLELFKTTMNDVAEKGWLETQANVGGRYFTRDDMDRAKRLDVSTMTADEIALRARAFWYPPFEGAYIERDGQRFTVVPPEALSSLKSLHQN